MIAASGRVAEARAHDRRRRFDDLERVNGSRVVVRGASAAAAASVARHSLTSDPIHAGDAGDAVARRRRSGRRRLLGRGDLRQLALDQHAHLREIRAPRAIERRDLILDAADFGARLVEHPLGFRARFAHDQLRLLLRLLADLAAQLLRRDERVVDRLVALAKRAQLLVEAARLRLEILVDARRAARALRRPDRGTD